MLAAAFYGCRFYLLGIIYDLRASRSLIFVIFQFTQVFK